jgi:hypothetical protein
MATILSLETIVHFNSYTWCPRRGSGGDRGVDSETIPRPRLNRPCLTRTFHLRPGIGIRACVTL